MNDSFFETEKNLLAQRAKRFAKEKVEQSQALKESSIILVFNLGDDQKYAIYSDDIERIFPYQKITSIPLINPLFSGLIYSNSECIPVINLSAILGCKKIDTMNFIIVTNEKYHYAFSVGFIIEQILIDKSEQLIQLPVTSEEENHYVLGVFKPDISILNISAIFKLLESLPLISENT